MGLDPARAQRAPLIESVLIANRGEIAVRIIRACRDLGLRTVAVYSDADSMAPHVLAADEAHRIGPAPASDSYLQGSRIVHIAKELGVSAVHPGYGFLAERASFAREVTEAGIVFIGPSAHTIDAMGDKTEARTRMRAAGVPIVPGVVDPVDSPEEAARIAAEIGFPVLLKAAAGGGGKGMRVIESPDQVTDAFDAARREAISSFGDGSVYLERYLHHPRHIEIQVFGDAHGNVIHLGERDCSIQRRHQKLIEEAPSAVLDAATREAMGQAAVRAARSVDYEGAGTVEFLYQDGEFFFLEMNTRLQVEHPVTELITGLDLVRLQLEIAGGAPLPVTQEEVVFAGHAIECRITSEDPRSGFLPSTGTVRELTVPGGAGVRWDGGVAPGFRVGLEYDSLLGKLVVHGRDRASAIGRMSRALEELRIAGVQTSAEFHLAVMREPDFRRGEFTIRYLEEHPDLLADARDDDALRDVAVAAAILEDSRTPATGSLGPSSAPDSGFSAWRRAYLYGEPT